LNLTPTLLGEEEELREKFWGGEKSREKIKLQNSAKRFLCVLRIL